MIRLSFCAPLPIQDAAMIDLREPDPALAATGAVSPELVLVDPELGRIERARAAPPPLRPRATAQAPAVQPRPPAGAARRSPPTGRPLLPAAAGVAAAALLAGGFQLSRALAPGPERPTLVQTGEAPSSALRHEPVEHAAPPPAAPARPFEGPALPGVTKLGTATGAAGAPAPRRRPHRQARHG